MPRSSPASSTSVQSQSKHASFTRSPVGNLTDTHQPQRLLQWCKTNNSCINRKHLQQNDQWTIIPSCQFTSASRCVQQQICKLHNHNYVDVQPITTHNATRSVCITTLLRVVEQPSVQPTTVRLYPSSVQPGVKDVFVWLTGTQHLVTFVFSVLYKCPYLLTYCSPVL